MRVKRVGEQGTLEVHPRMPERIHVAADVAQEDRRIRILLADEQSLFREAVRSVLEAEPDFDVVGEARDGLQAVAEAERSSRTSCSSMRPSRTAMGSGRPA